MSPLNLLQYAAAVTFLHCINILLSLYLLHKLNTDLFEPVYIFEKDFMLTKKSKTSVLILLCKEYFKKPESVLV